MPDSRRASARADFGYIRSMKKMRLRAGMALLVMLGMAFGWLRAGKPEYLRSLVGEPRAA